MILDSHDPQPATWWIPGMRSRRQGTYTVSSDGGVEATMIGSLEGRSSGIIPVVFADVEGTHVTCEDVVLTRAEGRGQQERSTYWVTRAFEGLRARRPTSQTFETAVFGVDNLEQFRRIRVLDRSEPRLGLVSEDRHELRLAVENFGEMSLFTHVEESPTSLPESVAFRVMHSVQIWPQRPSALRDLWRDMVMPVVGLMTLAGQGDGRASDLHLKASGKAGPRWGLVKTRVHNSTPTAGDRSYSDMVIHDHNWDIAENFAAWVRLWHLAPVAFTSFDESLRMAHVAPQLTYAASACEALHEALRPEAGQPTEPGKARLERVLAVQEGLSGRDRNWAKRQLIAHRSPSLESRLQKLVHGIDAQLAEEMIGDVPRWSRQVADARNAISHSDRRAAEYHTNPRLMYAITGTLQALFSLNVMRRIGFTTEQAAQAWRDNFHLAQRIREYPNLAGD